MGFVIGLLVIVFFLGALTGGLTGYDVEVKP